MKVRISALVAFIFILSTLFCLLHFRTLPATKIWNNYNVLYVSNSVTEQAVLSYLEQNGCRGVITRSLQKVPFSSGIVTLQPRQSTYLEDRLQYFRDESATYRLYYVPSVYQKQVHKALSSIIKELHVEAGVDGREKYPWVVPLVCLIAYLFLGIMAKHKSVFFVPTSFLLLLTLSLPFHTVAAGVCLLCMAFFLINPLWKRRKSVRAIVSNVYFDVLLATGIALLFLESLVAGILGLLCIGSAVLLFIFMWHVHTALQKRNDFSFEYIFSATQVSLLHKKALRCLASLSFPLFALFLLFVISAFFSTSSGSIQGLSIPSPVTYTEGVRPLPNLENYFDWVWKTLTFPYKNLNAAHSSGLVTEGETVQEISFVKEQGLLRPFTKTLFTYDDAFRTSAQKNIEALDYAPIEKLLQEAGREGTVAYNSGIETAIPQEQSGFNVLLLLIALTEPIVLYALYYILGRKKYEDS